MQWTGQGPRLQPLLFFNTGHGNPPNFGIVTTALTVLCTPLLPQVAVHFDHVFHSLTRHLTGVRVGDFVGATVGKEVGFGDGGDVGADVGQVCLLHSFSSCIGQTLP